MKFTEFPPGLRLLFVAPLLVVFSTPLSAEDAECPGSSLFRLGDVMRETLCPSGYALEIPYTDEETLAEVGPYLKPQLHHLFCLLFSSPEIKAAMLELLAEDDRKAFCGSPGPKVSYGESNKPLFEIDTVIANKILDQSK